MMGLLAGHLSRSHLSKRNIYINAKVVIMMLIISNSFGKNSRCTFSQMPNRISIYFLLFNEGRHHKSQHNVNMTKIATMSGTQDRKNQV